MHCIGGICYPADDHEWRISTSPNDSDFVRLLKYMGAKSVEGDKIPEAYTAQILPNLTDMEEKMARWYWSSTVLPDNSDLAYVFVGRNFYYARRFDGVSVRCVVSSKAP